MRPLRVKIHSSGTTTWRCDACGAYNDDSLVVCAECTATRDSAIATPRTLEVQNDENEASLPEPSPFPEDISKEKEEEAEEPEIEKPDAEEPEISPEPQVATTPSALQATGQGRYYLVFVNTPAQSLIKSKVQVDFDDFPVISIGRSPENVVVIPDQEVSRKHAELTMDGTRLVLKDLKSKNGTYLYNGKAFEQVSDSVEVKPNSLVKFGTGTIVRITSE